MRFNVRDNGWAVVFLVAGALAAMGPGRVQASAVGRAAQMAVNGDRISVAVDDGSLRETMTTLARAASIAVSFRGEPSGERVTANLHDVALEDGVRRLLQGHSYVLRYAAPPDSGSPTPRLAEIVVLGDAWSSDGNSAAPSDRPASAAEPVRTATPTPDDNARQTEARDRERALRRAEHALRRGEAAPVPGRRLDDELVVALAHSDAWTRAAALDQLRHSQDPVPVKLLARVAREESQAWLRVRALELLAERAGAAAREPLRRALWDPEPEVQQRAAELLDDLRRSVPDPGLHRRPAGDPGSDPRARR